MENKCQIVIFFIFEMFVVSQTLPKGGDLSSLREQLVEEKISDPTPSWLNILCSYLVYKWREPNSAVSSL